MSFMRARLFRPASGEQIHVVDISEQGGTYCGTVEVLTCLGSTLALFHQLERMANENVIGEAERVSEQIDELGFLVDGLPGLSRSAQCNRLQLMNGADLCFRVNQPSDDVNSRDAQV
jgi:hypothetical protein